MTTFEFNPADVTPQTAIAVEGSNVQAARDVTALNPTLKHPHTDAGRIFSARARHKASYKANNLPGAKCGMQICAEWFEDGMGPQTSAHDFQHLLFVLSFLRTQVSDTRFESIGERSQTKYNPRTGICGGEYPISIGELEGAVEQRCEEVGISLVLLEEWLATIHSIVEDREFQSLTFDQQMSRFKAAQ